MGPVEKHETSKMLFECQKSNSLNNQDKNAKRNKRRGPEMLTCSFAPSPQARQDLLLHTHLGVLTDRQSLPSVIRVSSHEIEIWTKDGLRFLTGKNANSEACTL